MPKATAMRAAYVAIGANLVLLLLKGSASGLSDSLTIFSETLNSLADAVAAVVTLLCVRLAWTSPDADHPFGHGRAEPVAGLVVAIFTGILGFEVCKKAALDLLQGSLPQHIGPYPIAALCLTAAVKSALLVYFRRRGAELNSPALRATAIDCRNDVAVALQGLVGVVMAELGLPLLDRIAALLVGVYILYSGHRIGMENLDYLLGRAPDAAMIERIRAAAQRVRGVLAIEDIRAHYVGTFVHVELTAVVDGAISTTESHDVCEATRAAVESVAVVDRAFVHISPRIQPAPPAGPIPPPTRSDS